MRLIEVSRSSVDIHLDKSARQKYLLISSIYVYKSGCRVEGDPITRIYALIRDLAAGIATSDAENAKVIPLDGIRDLVLARGFSEEQLQQCLHEFDQCNIWSVAASGASLKIYN